MQALVPFPVQDVVESPSVGHVHEDPAEVEHRQRSEWSAARRLREASCQKLFHQGGKGPLLLGCPLLDSAEERVGKYQRSLHTEKHIIRMAIRDIIPIYPSRAWRCSRLSCPYYLS